MSSNQTLLDSLGADTMLWHPSTDKKSAPSDLLSNKLVLIYFSAHWCGPCRRFTPILSEMYKKLKANSATADFELIFSSMDRTDAEYKDYCSEMPWWCMPHQSPVLDRLASQYGAEGIPHLVVLDKDGNVLTTEGVGEVSMDPQGANFPWRPKLITELLPEQYVHSDKKTLLPVADLDDKYLMLYFSAHWCPPCKQFTPKMTKAYTALKEKRDDFELLFVSSDRDEAAFNEYFNSMSFCAMPFFEREAKAAISKRLGVRGIPALFMLGPVDKNTGERPIVNDNVRSVIESGDYMSEFPYKPKNYGDLNFASDSINKTRCVLVFCEGGDDDEQEDVQETLKMAAAEHAAVTFLWATDPTGLSQAVRQALKLGPMTENAVMVLMDIPDAGSYYVSSESDITLEAIQAFMESPGEKNKLSGG